MKLSKKEILYNIGIFLLVIKVWISISNYMTLMGVANNILLFASYSFFLISMFFDGEKYKIKDMILILILLVIGVSTYYFSKYTDLLTVIIIFIATKNVRIKKTIKIILYSNSILLLLHIILYCIIMLFQADNKYLITRITNGRTIYRYSFGLIHPNTFGIVCFWTTAIFYYLNFKNLNLKIHVLTIGMALFIWIFPNSRTTAIAIIILVLLSLLYSKGRLKLKKIKVFYLITLIVCILSLFFIDNGLISAIDKMLNNRLTLAYLIYLDKGISLFGYNISEGISANINRSFL